MRAAWRRVDRVHEAIQVRRLRPGGNSRSLRLMGAFKGWRCVQHGYTECSRCEPPLGWQRGLESPTQPITGTHSHTIRVRQSTPEEVGRAVLIQLQRHRDSLRARAASREVEIEALISDDSGPERGRARRLWMRLSGSNKPSLRTVQWYLRRITQRRQHCASSDPEADAQ